MKTLQQMVIHTAIEGILTDTVMSGAERIDRALWLASRLTTKANIDVAVSTLSQHENWGEIIEGVLNTYAPISVELRHALYLDAAKSTFHRSLRTDAASWGGAAIADLATVHRLIFSFIDELDELAATLGVITLMRDEGHASVAPLNVLAHYCILLEGINRGHDGEFSDVFTSCVTALTRPDGEPDVGVYLDETYNPMLLLIENAIESGELPELPSEGTAMYLPTAAVIIYLKACGLVKLPE